MKFTELLTEYRVPYKTEGSEHCRPGWVQIDCPYCEPDAKKWHMGYSIEGKFLNCYRCGFKPLVPTIQLLTGLSHSEASKLVSGMGLFSFKQERVKGQLLLPKGLGPLHQLHKIYLRQRGYDTQALKRLWHIGGINQHAEYAWRIFIPVFDKGKVVSWSTRAIGKSSSKYLHAPPERELVPIKSLLYGEEYLIDTGVFVEGITDVWAIGPGAAATMGTGYTQAQVLKMSKYKTRVICFDNEPEAQKRAKKLSDDLSVFPGDTYNVVLDAKDPGEASPKEIKKLRKEFLE